MSAPSRFIVPFLVAVCACGRFGFDPAVSDGDGGLERGDGGSDDAPPVVGDSGTGIDAVSVGDAGPCPADCNGGCPNGVCVIVGTDQAGVIRCPDAWPCRVDCLQTNACPSDVDCSGASSCEVNCLGDDSCFFGVECNAGPCSVTCGGDGACGGTVSCNAAPSCTVTCSGPNSCPFATTCATDCAVTCTGTASCSGGVDCVDACACDVACDPVAQCPDQPGFVECPAGCDVADGCTTQAAGCNTCP